MPIADPERLAYDAAAWDAGRNGRTGGKGGMSTGPRLTTRTIGETESALNGLPTNVLDDTGIDEVGWVAVRLSSTMPPPVTVAALTARLRASKKVDEATIAAILGDLEGRGILKTTGDTISTTPEGPGALRATDPRGGQADRSDVGRSRLEDLATAARVLTAITERANELLLKRTQNE
jgi:hypothetical protein